MNGIIRRILLPTDLSDFSKAAAAWALMFHRRFGSEITLLFANQPYIPMDIMGGPAAYSPQNEPDYRHGIAEELRKFAAESLPEVEKLQTVILEMGPADAIVRTADKIDADLILMGTHGRQGWRRALLGSVTEHTLRATSRPLMSVPAFLGTPMQPTISRILCPVNFTDVGRLALEEAAGLAESFLAELVVVHVVELADEPFLTHLEQEFAAWVEPGIRDRCSYRQVVIRGNAAELVLATADETGADLIVVGAQHKRFRDATVIGTTTERVVRFARQPVWTVVSPVEATNEEQMKRNTAVPAG
jgi:nucleotide-binding universal stress UspA family protein